jgi:hypothetical protein
LKILFDNNLSPNIAHAMRELSRAELDVQDVIHLRDRFLPRTPDMEWIGALVADGPWVVISIDRFTKQNGAERAALRSAGHTVFVMDSQWAEHRYWLQAERLVRWWPQVLAQARLVSASAFRVPWHHNSKSKFTVIRL